MVDTYRVRTFISYKGTGFIVGAQDDATDADVIAAINAAKGFAGPGHKVTDSDAHYTVTNDERLTITVWALEN
jgi:hypothetical protein